MQIRSAQAEDIETLFQIRTSVIENYQSREELWALGITPKTVAQMLQEDCHAWIAEINGQPIGFSFANRSEATIFGLFVRPAYEGRGAGRALLAVAETWLASQGCEEIWLMTGNDPTLRAYGFYEHLGWQAVGVQSNAMMKFIKRCC